MQESITRRDGPMAAAHRAGEEVMPGGNGRRPASVGAAGTGAGLA